MPTYIAEVHWTCDESHREFVTMALEDHNLSLFSSIRDLEDPRLPQSTRDFYFHLFQRIANIQKGSKGPARLKTIYRVGCVRDNNLANDGPRILTFYMTPVFRFDQNGENPVLVNS